MNKLPKKYKRLQHHVLKVHTAISKYSICVQLTIKHIHADGILH